MWKALVEWWRWKGVGEDVRQLCLSLDVTERWVIWKDNHVSSLDFAYWDLHDKLTSFNAAVRWNGITCVYTTTGPNPSWRIGLTKRERAVVDYHFERAVKRYEKLAKIRQQAKDEERGKEEREKFKQLYLPPVLTDVVHICQCVCKCKGENNDTQV